MGPGNKAALTWDLEQETEIACGSRSKEGRIAMTAIQIMDRYKKAYTREMKSVSQK